MKKIIALLTALVMVLCLAACGGPAAPETVPETTVPVTAAAPETVPVTTAAPGTAATEPQADDAVILTAEAPLNGMTAAITLTLDFDGGTALLTEVAAGFGMEFKLLGETEADITEGFGMPVGRGAITSNEDGTWTVSFLENALNLTVRQAEGVYTASLSPMGGMGLIDCPMLTAPAGSEELTVTGTVNAMDVVVTLTLDLTSGTATLSETANAYGMEFKLLGETEADISEGFGMPVGQGVITSNEDGTWAVSFLEGAMVFAVTQTEDGSYTVSTAPLAAMGLIDTVTASSAT